MYHPVHGSEVLPICYIYSFPSQNVQKTYICYIQFIFTLIASECTYTYYNQDTNQLRYPQITQYLGLYLHANLKHWSLVKIKMLTKKYYPQRYDRKHQCDQIYQLLIHPNSITIILIKFPLQLAIQHL